MKNEKKKILKNIKEKSYRLIKISYSKNNKISKTNSILSIIFNIIKVIIKKIIFLFLTSIEFIILGIPFVLMGYFMKEEAKKVNFTISEEYSNNYSRIFIIFFVISSKCLKGKIGKIYYSFLFIFHYLLFLTNIIFYSVTNTFFQFKVLSFTGEGSHYIISALLGLDKKTWINIIITFVSFIFAFIIFRKTKKNNIPILFISFILFIYAQEHIKNLFGPVKGKNWNDFDRPNIIFAEFTNSNKCMKIVGFYKFIQKDFSKTYLNFNIFTRKDNKEELDYLKNIYKDIKMHSENNYTGIFKDKNLIFIQLESLDHFLINEKNAPTLYSLKNNSLFFADHYSFLIAGSTFNSEFCINTGFYTPVTFNSHSYEFHHNTFISIPKQFKKLGYTLKGFHYNDPEFYSRDVNYIGWGYDKFLSLLKTNTNYKNHEEAGLDTELIKNKEFYDEIFNTKGKFLYYFITYSVHFPYKNIRGSHTHYILKNKGINGYTSEEDIIRTQAGETDEFVNLLIEGLKKHNLYDNTVIVFVTDHSCGLRKQILSKYKIISDKRINRTPFFIWSNNIKGQIINKTNSQLDILPTVLNLFGIPFQENVMIGRDIFDDNYSGIAFFEDYSWIDGNILINNGKITKLKDISDKDINDNYITKKTQKVREKFKQNDLTLKYDYLKHIIKN